MRLFPLFAIVVLAAVLPSLTRAAGEGPRLVLPLACVIGQTCEVQHYVDRDPGPGAADYRCSHRTYDKHSGVDIRLLDMAAQKRGVDVLAAAPGRVARLRDGEPDVSVRTTGVAAVANKECGNGVVIEHGDGWETQYCHLARGSIRVRPGDVVQAGTPIGKVGLSGQTEFPHLHMTVRHDGQVVDPFAPKAPSGTCAAQGSMWASAAARALYYKSGVILNSGFAGVPVSDELIEAGGIAPPDAGSPALVAYMRVIEPDKGDELEITIRSPDGAVLVSHRQPPLDRDKAQYFAMAGKKRPPAGWPKGRYVAELKVWRGGKAVMQKRVETVL
jgi:hypothetical protein